MDEVLSDQAIERRRDDYGHILLVDDDAQLRLLVARFLERYGFLVTSVEDGPSARESLERGVFDLVVLDVMLPGMTGIEICRELRATSNLPIIMLTARSDEISRIAGLEGGADDYVTKPFNPREFLARVRSLLRRARLNNPASGKTQPSRATFGQWSLDFLRRELVSPQGALIDLSTGEYDLLVVFIEHPNKVLSRDALMELAKARMPDPLDRAIDVQISRLRKKLDLNGEPGQFIKTVRGTGYMFAGPVIFESA